LQHNRPTTDIFSFVFGAFASCDEAIDVNVVVRYRRIPEGRSLPHEMRKVAGDR